MKDYILRAAEDSVKAVSFLKEGESVEFIEKVACRIAHAFKKGNKLIVCGNGGSMCDASHFAEELTGFFRKKREAYPAIVLSEVGHLTCVANDIGFDHVFSRGVEAFGRKGDIFVALTTSGNSKNLLNALEAAKERELYTVAFLGKGGGKMRGAADLEWIVDGFSTSDRLQEAHMAAIHIIIEVVERYMESGVDLLKRMKGVFLGGK